MACIFMIMKNRSLFEIKNTWYLSTEDIESEKELPIAFSFSICYYIFGITIPI